MDKPLANIVAEGELLGLLMAYNNPANLSLARSMVTADMLYSDKYAEVFKAFCLAGDHGQDVNPQLCPQHHHALLELEATAPLPSALKLLCIEIRLWAMLRKAYDGAQAIIQQIDSSSPYSIDPDQIVIDQNQLAKELREMIIVGEAKSITDIMARTVKEIETASKSDNKLVGITSGLPLLDRYTHGWKAGDFIILAARPGMGKTTLALHFMLQAAREGKKVTLYSLEMSDLSIGRRMIAAEAKISHDLLISAKTDDQERARAFEAAGKLGDLPITIKGGGMIEIEQLCADVSRAQKMGKTDLVIIDQLTFLYMADKEIRKQGYRVEIQTIVSRLASLSKETNIPIILLHQLNREVESSINKRPHINHLKESGRIEEAADVVLLLYRPEYYRKEDEVPDDERNVAEIIIGKNRDGRTGFVKTGCDLSTCRFFDSEQSFKSPPEVIDYTIPAKEIF